MECPSTANFCHQCGQQLNLSQVSNKAASSVDKEKLLKEYFHPRWKYSFNSFSWSTEFEIWLWLKLSCWPHRWQKFAVEGYSIPHELQNILSKWSHRPRKSINCNTHSSFIQCAGIRFDVLICSNILLICSNSFWKFAATLFNLQQLYFICSMSLVGHRTNETC